MATTPQLLTRTNNAFNRQEAALKAMGHDIDLQSNQPNTDLERIAVRAERVADVLEAAANATPNPAPSAVDTGTAADETATATTNANATAATTTAAEDQTDNATADDSASPELLTPAAQPTSGTTTTRRAAAGNANR